MDEFGKSKINYIILVYYENEFKDATVEDIKKRLFDEGRDVTQFSQDDIDSVYDDIENSKVF